MPQLQGQEVHPTIEPMPAIQTTILANADSQVMGLTVKKMPKTVGDVYDGDVKYEEPTDLALVRKKTREVIFPKTKFVGSKNRTRNFDYPQQFRQKTIPYVLLQSVGYVGGHSEKTDVERAIFWNTYRKEVEKTMRQCQSTSMSSVKKMFMKGEYEKEFDREVYC